MRRALVFLVLMTVLSPLAACGPTPEPQVIEKIVTQEVEKEVVVTKEVEKEVVVTQEVEVVVTKEVEVIKEVEKEEEPPEPVELSMWYYNWAPGYEYWAERVRMYTQENPHVTVDFDHTIPPVGEGGFEDKVTSSLATGTAPDLFVVINPQAIKLINKGQLAPIDDEALGALGYDSIDELLAVRLPGALEPWTDDLGTPYAQNSDISWLVVFCSDEHLKAAGLDPDTVELETWEDFIALGTQVIEANPDFYLDDAGKFQKNFMKQPMYMDDTWSMQVLTTFLAQTGGSVLSDDRTECTINQPEGVEAVEWMIRIDRELGDPNIGPVIPGEIHAAWSSGEQTCDLSGPWMHEAFLVAVDSPLLNTGYHVYGTPIVPGGEPGNVFWGWSWVVNAESPNKEEAWKLIRFLLADPQGQAAASGLWQPVPDIEQGWGAGRVPYADVIAPGAEGGQAIFITEHYAEIARIVRGAIEVMAFEGADVQETLDAACEEIQPILDGK
jgi:ABC-type glycerol-3-phosphate transport system substrate-binding protein